jgi:penicillin-binding protein 1C
MRSGARLAARAIVALGVARAAGGILRATASPLLQGVSFSRAVYDRDGRLLRLSLSGDEKYRLFTPLAEAGELLPEAFLLREDRAFYWHPGLNPGSLARAALATLASRGKSEVAGENGGEGRLIGGSTITMQLARMQSGLRTRSALGKLRQLALALWIEARHSKREILEAYLNLAPFGGNVEGIGAASLIAYRKEPRAVSLPEALTLATIPQSPSSRGFPSQAASGAGRVVEARLRLFAAWVERHPADRGRRSDLDLPLVSERASSLPFAAPHFVDQALRRASAGDLGGALARDADEWGAALRPPGPPARSLRATLDLELQKLVEGKIKGFVASRSGSGVRNAAALLIDHQTMEVLAWAGSADWADDSIQGQVNGVLAKRSPGSAIKPFIYARAFDQGLIHPESLLKDTRMSFGAFDPENFDGDFRGPVSARDALIHSRNVPAVYLASLLRDPSAYELVKLGGISRLREPGFYGLSIALGGAEATMEEMIRLYAALAARGKLRDLRLSLDEPPSPARAELFSPEAAFLTLDILKDNPRPEQRFDPDWVRGAIPVAWKTGTSRGFRDAWAIGLFGRFALATWVGNFDNEANQAFVGRDMAGPLFFSMVDGLKARAGERAAFPDWLDPAGLNVKKVKACALSGRIPGPRCAREIDTWFIPGRSPIKPCDVHREIWLARDTGLRACRPDPRRAYAATFEFWPSDLLETFRAAGLPRRPPPDYEKGCGADTGHFLGGSLGIAPQITSPKLGLTYALRAGKGEENAIPFFAVADGDARRLTWFVGNELVGQGPPSATVFWRSRPGKYLVRVVDDLGRADARELEVMVSR